MARMARVVVPGYPHHVTQRGSRGQKTFFDSSDYELYLQMLSQRKAEVGTDILAYCLMPNHVHVVAVPNCPRGLAELFGFVHKQYALRVNKANGWSGHLWQERFYSVVMDEAHLLAAVRYVELNPVRAGLCDKPDNWPWSSAATHLNGTDDDLLSLELMKSRVPDWRDYLSQESEPAKLEALRRHTGSGRPVGDEGFMDRLEALTGRRLRRRKPGRKKADDQGVN
jgi:putative transposase